MTVMIVLLLLLFVCLGIFLIGLGIWIQRRAYGKHSVEVEAECIDVMHEDYKSSIDPTDHMYLYDAKRPIYRYWYNGRYYTSAPLLRSNRRGYRPEQGKCMIRINPDHPERVYSSERKYASGILILIGSIYLLMVVVVSVIFWKTGVFNLLLQTSRCFMCFT